MRNKKQVNNNTYGNISKNISKNIVSKAFFRTVTSALASSLVLSPVLCLSACDGQVPKPVESQTSKEQPDLTMIKEKDIRFRVLCALERANDEKNVDGLDEYLSGPALDVRTSELTVAKKIGKLDPKTTIPREVAQTIVPTNSSWPRDVMTITTTTKDQQSKRLLVFRQDRARANYKLWAVARLFPGVHLPKFAVPSIGSSMGKENDSGLIMTPRDAIAAYADVLQNNDNSKFAKRFSNDYLRQKLTELSKTVQEGMERNKGTQNQTFTPSADVISVMRSTDGSDLVVARIDSVWIRKAGEGRESRPASDEEKALFGNSNPKSTMRVTYVNVIALVIPPAGSNMKITPVGAERQPIKVEAL